MAEENERHGKTLFIRNLLYTSTNESLEKVFSDVGPLKSCFVVKDKDSGKCRGFGYVKFTLHDDAERALSTIKKVDGRNVHIVFANKKEKKKRFGQPVRADDKNDVEVRETSKGEEIEEEHRKDLKLKEETIQSPGKKKKKQTRVAPPVKGQKQEPNPLNEGKRARLIVRNLSFKCTTEELKRAFDKCGKVVDVHIPQKGNGVKYGFGFVQFENKAQAGMAVAQINGVSIAGRPVAVDWSLPKNMYEAKLPAKAEEASKHSEYISEEEEDMEVDEDGQSQVMTNLNDSNSRQGKLESVKSAGSSQPEDADSDEDDNDEDDDGESDEDDDDESDEEDESDEDEESESVAESSDEDSGIDEQEMQKKKTQQQPERLSDVSQGRTIFVRNLPFTAEEEDIEELFSQFGEVKYARIVKDRISGMSKGSAFVQFMTKESATASMETASPESTMGLNMQGRTLLVSLAVSREQAGVLSKEHEEDKKKKLKGTSDGQTQKDSRNLYLAREGMIRPGTEAAKDVSSSDMALRTKIAEANRIKLKDQNIFVSSTRLCIHNIPPTIEDNKLRKIVLKAVADKDAHITECRIMRDLQRVNSQGQGKSRGFAFCSFTQHSHALAALKKLNNCPNLFGDKKRPIVEFSLENRKALEAKQKRVEKSKLIIKQKGGMANAANRDNGQKLKKKRKNKPSKTKQDVMPLEMKKQQDQVARAMYKGPLGLPSHSGPKVRHKARPGQQMEKKKGNKLAQKANNKSLPPKSQKEMKTKTMKPQKKRKDVDNFDKLVASYKQKIMASAKF